MTSELPSSMQQHCVSMNGTTRRPTQSAGSRTRPAIMVVNAGDSHGFCFEATLVGCRRPDRARDHLRADVLLEFAAEAGQHDAEPQHPAGARAQFQPAKSGDTPVPTVPTDRAGGYAVQVGAFKAEDEANKLRDRLRNGGVAAFIEKVGGGEQTMWKVRAGPYVDRVGADIALANIKQKFQITGMITTQPDD